jgi:hypothetical protein
MTKLSDTQSIILSAAAQRPDGNLLPLPGSLRGGAAGKVVGALLARGLIREQVLDSHAKADSALNTIWRNLEDGRGVLLFITAAGLEALGIEPNDVRGDEEARDAASEPTSAHGAAQAPDGPEPAGAPDRGSAGHTAPPATKTRTGTKQAALIAMLKRPEGATIAEIVDATGWQPHTVRGALAGALKKRLGLEVISEKLQERGRVYRIAC